MNTIIMEDVKLEHSRTEHKLKLFTMGLNVEVQPYWLIQQMINENSQNILDEMIESKYKDALGVFSKWQDNVLKEISESNVDGMEVFEENKYEVHHKEIQDVADISRNLLPLHSGWECIELTEVEQKAVEFAYQYWKYNEFYGHEK